MKKLHLCLLFLLTLCTSAAFAQTAILVTNDGTTGTTINQTAIVNSSLNAIAAGTSNTAVPAYIVIAGAGTSGQAQLATSGPASCIMDSTIASAAGWFYVINSTTVAKDCHAQSGTPSAGTYVIGYLSSTSTTTGAAAQVMVSPMTIPGSGSMVYPGAGIPQSTGSAWGTSVAGAAAGDLLYYNGSAWAKFAGNASGNLYLSENGSGVPSWGTPSGSAPTFPDNAQTATYQVLAADFAACKTISVASGTFTVTLVASGSQPATGQCIDVINYGSGVVTIARSGQNINGGVTSLTLTAGSATAPTGAHVISDGTNYKAALWGIAGSGAGTVNTGVSGHCTIYLSSTAAVSSDPNCDSGVTTANVRTFGESGGVAAKSFNTTDTVNNTSMAYGTGSSGDSTCPTPTAGKSYFCTKSSGISISINGGAYTPVADLADTQTLSNKTFVAPVLGAATATSLLASGIVDGQAPVTITTAASATLGGTYNSGYTFNQDATAATAIIYTLPTAAAGKQYCVGNSYNGSAATTGTLEILTSASGQFIIFTDGTLSATGGFVQSGGAAADTACVVGVDSTHWMLFVQRGTWSKH